MRTRPSSPFRRNPPGARWIGWLTVTALLGLAMLGPGTSIALGATQGWTGNGWPVNEDCEDAAAGHHRLDLDRRRPDGADHQRRGASRVVGAGRRRIVVVEVRVAMVRHRARPCDHVRDLHG